ncbi:acireductone dioxygenase-like [Amblyomma americanum]
MPENKLMAWYVNEPGKVMDAQGIQQIIGGSALFYEAPSAEDGAAMLDRIRREKTIRFEDRLYISPRRDDYASTTEMIGREHKHPDEEVRYFERGTGYLDVRDPADRWLRLQVGPGHLVVLPAHTYHRFSPASLQEDIVVHRLFEDVDAWTADFRGDS